MKTPANLFLLAICAVGIVPNLAGGAEAIDNWNRHCAKCHAPDGSGATPTGKALHVKNYTDAAVQAQLNVEDMFKAIKEGVKNPAGKTVMPNFAEKLADDEIASLIALVRTFKKE
jgi:mono/diheme cytochrome c family protein